MIKDLILENRSCRRFDATYKIEYETLLEMVDTARFVASGMNFQPLRYALSVDPEKNKQIYSALTMGGKKFWREPYESERPTGYIVILGDTTVTTHSLGIDTGIAAQTILLQARERGLAGCIIGIARHEIIRQVFDIPERYRIVIVIALGKPTDRVIIEEHGPEKAQTMFRDDDDVQHVGKRLLKDIILNEL